MMSPEAKQIVLAACAGLAWIDMQVSINLTALVPASNSLNFMGASSKLG